MTGTGVDRRLKRIFNGETGRALVVPIDDSLIAGPQAGLADLRQKVSQIADGGPDAVLGFPGHFEQYADKLARVAWICNLTASTIRVTHTRKTQILSVRQALALGCDGVAAHVNTTSRYEAEMIATLAGIVAEARENGTPVVAIMYPRTEGPDGDDNYEHLRATDPERYTDLVCHAVRLAKDLGASAIKTQFTGSQTTFARVVQAADPLPVLVAGGPMIPVLQSLERAESAISAGARGISFGRNVFGREPSGPMIQALRAIIHESVGAEEAYRRFRPA